MTVCASRTFIGLCPCLYDKLKSVYMYLPLEALIYTANAAKDVRKKFLEAISPKYGCETYK